MDQLAKQVFNSEEERREYELMLERRFDYIVAKRKELNEQWAQYWPSDKPETLVCLLLSLLYFNFVIISHINVIN